MKTNLRQLLFVPMVVMIVGCASDSETESEPSQRTRGMQVSAGIPNTIDCPSRNSTCYANVRKMCGDLGVEEVSIMGQSRVTTAGRSGDDPFARADHQKNYDQPVSLRCKDPKPGTE